jgi:hypothetical protein
MRRIGVVVLHALESGSSSFLQKKKRLPPTKETKLSTLESGHSVVGEGCRGQQPHIDSHNSPSVGITQRVLSPRELGKLQEAASCFSVDYSGESEN